MATGEDQLKALVRELRCLGHHTLRGFNDLEAQLLELLGQRAFAPDTVDRSVPPGRDQPRCWIRRYALARPALGSDGERLLCRLFGELHVAEVADERREDAPPLTPEDLVEHLNTPDRPEWSDLDAAAGPVLLQ